MLRGKAVPSGGVAARLGGLVFGREIPQMKIGISNCNVSLPSALLCIECNTGYPAAAAP